LVNHLTISQPFDHWSNSFLQYWNRYEGELAHRWGVADLETRERVRFYNWSTI
jgi:hypothetical protein